MKTKTQKKRLTIRPNRDRECPETYANFCEAQHSPFELTLTFCKVSGIRPEDLHAGDSGDEAVVYADPVARVVLPFGVVSGMIRMLQDQQRRIEDAQADGPESEPEAGPDGGFSVVH